jgi:hypothetical protein
VSPLAEPRAEVQFQVYAAAVVLSRAHGTPAGTLRAMPQTDLQRIVAAAKKCPWHNGAATCRKAAERLLAGRA